MAPSEKTPLSYHSSLLEITNKFNEALHYIENSHQNLFITGKAGTGKSTLLEYCTSNTKKRFVSLAPTGVAALNIKGQTIHSFFNFYIDITPQKVIEDFKNVSKKSLYKNLEILIIDEVSMLRADLLDCIDIFLQIHGPKPHKPFGGVQMIFIGDLYQLPPVISKNDNIALSKSYNTNYFFSSSALKDTKLKIIELDTVFRQQDETFIELLNKIRDNSLTNNDLSLLNTRWISNEIELQDETFICLTATNKKADSINLERLNKIPTSSFTSEAHIEGDFSKDQQPTSITLQLKIGAQVMLLNNDSKRRWVNGTLGIIKAMPSDIHGTPFLMVELLHNHKIVSIYKHTWETFNFFALEEEHIVSRKVGSFTQYPVRLAWAITIHKSQGKTFNNIMIDLEGGSFAAGQTYVAFSRCTSFEGIKLSQQLKKSDIKTHSDVKKYFLENKTWPNEN